MTVATSPLRVVTICARSACLGLLLSFASCGTESSDAAASSSATPQEPVQETVGRGVLVVAIDALRADHLPAGGYDRGTMPAVTQLNEREGFTFTNVWSPGPGVVPAHLALLTGCDPSVGRQPSLPMENGSVAAPLFNWIIPPDVPRLAEEFLAHGWMTGGFVDHPSIAGLRGFRQGFRDFADAGGAIGDQSQNGERRIFGFEGVALRFVEWIKELDRDRDWFAYLHMNDLERLWSTDLSGLDRKFKKRPGYDLVPPAAAGQDVFFAVPRSRFGAGQSSIGEYLGLYDSAMSQLDKKLIRLFGVLQTQRRWQDTTIVIVGSYGLGFGEGGMIMTSGTLCPVDLHVPLLIRPAPSLGLAVGSSFDELASLLDLAPTLLDMHGLSVREGMHGQSLAPWMRAEVSEPREQDYLFASHGIYAGFAVTDGSWLLQVAEPGSRGPGALSSSWFGDNSSHRSEQHEVLYDLSVELPPGKMSHGVQDPVRAAAMRAAGVEWFEWMTSLQRVVHQPTFGGADVDAAELRALRERGLLGSMD
ncbi:MAG: arylsulfatase A-like enzyme [Planctomycetota bacterium]|jgi:arylsulfatase A-like enzyme